jgi:hypothetical protein
MRSASLGAVIVAALLVLAFALQPHHSSGSLVLQVQSLTDSAEVAFEGRYFDGGDLAKEVGPQTTPFQVVVDGPELIALFRSLDPNQEIEVQLTVMRGASDMVSAAKFSGQVGLVMRQDGQLLSTGL